MLRILRGHASCAQVQTATLIMYSNKVAFPARHSAAWADFVRQALEKRPHLRPSARTLLDHVWVKCAVLAFKPAMCSSL